MTEPVVIKNKNGKIQVGPFFINSGSTTAYAVQCERLVRQLSYQVKHKKALKDMGIKYIRFSGGKKSINRYFFFLRKRWEKERKKRGGKKNGVNIL